MSAAFQEFESHILEAEALWGAEIKQKAHQLLRCAQELRVAMEAFIDDKRSGGEHFKSDRSFGKQMRSTVAASSHDTENELTQKINAAIEAIEQQLRPHLRRN